MKKDFLILLIFLLPAVAPLMQKGYFPMHDDLQVMRQMELDKCFHDGQIPCRWVADMGYGYGYPLFNYYPPLPYYLGQVFRWMGFAYIDVVKIVGVIGFAAAGVFMYLLCRQFWGRLGGLIGAAVFTYAPYHSVDYYVRGAVNEFYAMAFYPLILWALYRLIQKPGMKWTVITALSVAALMLSHNPMLMIFTPVALVWVMFWWVRTRSLRSFPHLALSAVWAFSLAAFFTLPIMFEQKFAHLETLIIGYFNYLAHFLDLRQIFININWGYGASYLGPEDTMSFAIGYLQWILPLIVLVSVLVLKRFRAYSREVLLFSAILLGSLFLAHSRSTFFWKIFTPLEYLQFPWRFLTLSVFAASFLSAAVVLLPKKKLITSLVIFLAVLLNASYFAPREWWPDMTDAGKLTGKTWQLMITSGIFDYLPIDAPLPPADPPGGDLGIISGEASYATVSKTTNYQKYDLTVSSPDSVIEIQTYYFPGWKIFLDGKQVTDITLDPLLGRMKITVSEGRHLLEARFTNTPVRVIGNSLTVLGWIGLLVVAVGKMKGWKTPPVWKRKLISTP